MNIFEAVKDENEEVLRELIQAGCCVNQKDAEGRAPIHYAATQSFSDCLVQLIDAQADVNIKDSDGKTPLHWAGLSFDWDAHPILIKAGADLSIANNRGSLPEDVADHEEWDIQGALRRMRIEQLEAALRGEMQRAPKMGRRPI